MHLVAIAVRAKAQCPQCLGDTFARSIAETARCPSCNSMVPMDWWRDELLVTIQVSQLLCWPEGETFEESAENGFTIRSRRVKTACACGEPLDPMALSAAAAQGAFTCSACGRATPLREATATVRAAYPAFKLVVERFSATHDRRKAHVLLCDACGATLAPAEGATQVRCNYCEAVNLIDLPAAQASPPPFLLLIDVDDPSLAGLSINGRHLVR
jgi:LSD1 subclass zinc finger protein